MKYIWHKTGFKFHEGKCEEVKWYEATADNDRFVGSICYSIDDANIFSANIRDNVDSEFGDVLFLKDKFTSISEAEEWVQKQLFLYVLNLISKCNTNDEKYDLAKKLLPDV